ncbi:pentapeptide repeat-containing protein [Actinoplanes subtropicus]|uniref:pentapeptide repeat-containing protein n=1 Tax=Actinoplanes subtropicus TaxID=543632 RepID=UPI001FE065E7|nr:pentapeptide repeat-containing protein [Actinoplanes subtropicus]
MAARWRVAAVGLAAVGAVAIVTVLPAWLLAVDVGAAKMAAMTPVDRASSVNAIRGQILQALGAIAVLSGAVLAWRQLQHSAAATREQLMVQREGQLTDRYTKAVEQLAHTDTTVRIGGIYALDRIARESADDRPNIVNVLAAYLRFTSPWPPSDGQTAAVDLPLRVRRPDAQTALTVLCRWNSADLHPTEWLTADLTGTDLRHGNLEGGVLWHIRFAAANLTGANLRNTDLRGTDFTEAVLDGADLRGATADETTWWPDGSPLSHS